MMTGEVDIVGTGTVDTEEAGAITAGGNTIVIEIMTVVAGEFSLYICSQCS